MSCNLCRCDLFCAAPWHALVCGVLWFFGKLNDSGDDAGFVLFVGFGFFYGEFDPGSGRTLAACLTHASRAVGPLWGYTSGERVSNT